MSESYYDMLIKISNGLHFFGKYQEANALTALAIYCREKGIDNDGDI